MSSYQGLSEKYLGSAGSGASSALGLAGQQKTIASRYPAEYANMAAVDSNQSYDEALGIQNRNMSRMGINPNSGRFAGLQQKWALARAAAEAGARTRGRLNAENLQFSRLGQTAGTYNNATSSLRGVASDYGDISSQLGSLLGLSSGTTSVKSTGEHLGLNRNESVNSSGAIGVSKPSQWSENTGPTSHTPSTTENTGLSQTGSGSMVSNDTESGHGLTESDVSGIDTTSAMDESTYQDTGTDEIDGLLGNADYTEDLWGGSRGLQEDEA